MIFFLDQNGSLHDMQYDFRPDRSCEHDLHKAQDEILSSLINCNNRQVSILLLIDFSKAFDMLNMRFLLINFIIVTLEAQLCSGLNLTFITGCNL